MSCDPTSDVSHSVVPTEQVQRKISRTLNQRRHSRKISEYEMAKITSQEWLDMCEQGKKKCDSSIKSKIRNGLNNGDSKGGTLNGKCGACPETFCKHREMTYLEKYCFPQNYLATVTKRSYTKKIFQKIENCSDGNFICMICGSFFTSAEAMAMHQLVHGGTNAKESAMAKMTCTKDGFNFQCSECSCSFSSESHLFMHTKRTHKNNE